MSRSKVLFALSFLFLVPGCAGSSGVADSEVDAIKTTRSSLTTTDEFASPGVLHVRLAWGLLSWAEKGKRPEGFDWTGSATLSDGTAKLDMVTFFEKGDQAVAGEANQMKWNSHTYPHFDGVIGTLTPASLDGTLTIATPKFEKSLSVNELLSAGELRFDVDDVGHQLSISALPDENANCSGFVVGFSRDSSFKGLHLSNLGDRLGKLRFEVTDGKIAAEVVDLNGEVVDSGEGTLDAATHTFTIKLTTSTVTGLYQDPSYSSRGSFQATERCNASL
ncbi:MAG: hypothetical protein JNM17_19020 [Archangium sp.]|nr:hypothetical protein [Archangium sp.]